MLVYVTCEIMSRARGIAESIEFYVRVIVFFFFTCIYSGFVVFGRIVYTFSFFFTFHCCRSLFHNFCGHCYVHKFYMIKN